ncbi:hypothetical protein PDE_09444 [Penicillium oxalicum 114-2]|uniref:Uncharacterized protein n=1 Tax=Penicillium oxalicum (strain 114-2 / CGMCC 5302) TaxID=933388 RepID=S7ZUS8_PENO1|nr:hypothetical protein PDE_09444 [Penicillium oxalicum 114-2]
MTITSVQINIEHGDLSVNGLSAIVKLKRKKATPRPSQLTGRRYVALPSSLAVLCYGRVDRPAEAIAQHGQGQGQGQGQGAQGARSDQQPANPDAKNSRQGPRYCGTAGESRIFAIFLVVHDSRITKLVLVRNDQLQTEESAMPLSLKVTCIEYRAPRTLHEC